jgi:hypothetical protein
VNDSGNDRRVDDLRQQLRALGYLDAGIDRFVLAPAREARGPAALAVLAGIRIGCLSAALLGPAAAIGLSARLPGLVSGVRDAVVLAVYLGALFFVMSAVLSSAVSLIAAALVRGGRDGLVARAQRISVVTGWGVTIACLAYLTLWWRTANAEFGWSAPFLTTSALIVAVMISLLLGHAVRIATLAVVAAAHQGTASLPRVTSTSWRWVIAGGAVAFLGAAALLIWTAPADAAREERPPLTVVSTGHRVRLIAIDGFDPVVYRELTTSRQVTAVAHFMEQDRATLRAEDTRDPARAWTTIATGQPPATHGVTSIETRRVAGVQGTVAAPGGSAGRLLRTGTDLLRLTRPSVASRAERRTKTVWEVAADAGLRTSVVNWWATWPAPTDSGIVVTDRAMLRLEHGGDLDREIAPASLYAGLRSAWPAIRQRAIERARSMLPPVNDPDLLPVLRRSAELDCTVLELASALPAPARDLDVLYLPGLDIAQHTLLATAEGTSPSASTMSARVEALRSYYVFLDRALEPLLHAGDGEFVVLLTGPGRVESSAAGVLAMSGAGAANTVIPDGENTSVTPTLLYALGVPLSRELSAGPLTSMFDADFARRYPARYVATYGRPTATATPHEGRPLDQEMIDRLRSLGYVK